MTTGRLKTILDQFPSKKIIVLGDLIADEYIFTRSSRVSREAPVLILRYEGRKIALGGAANAIHNVRSLGAEVLPLGVIGKDEMGSCLLHLMQEKGISPDFICVQETYCTTTKTRVLAGSYHATKQQVARIDREPDNPLDRKAEDFIIHALEEIIHQADALLISDYGLGACSPRVKEKINQVAKQTQKIITVDSRYEILSYQGVTALTPNESEIEQALHMKILDDEDVKTCGQLAIQRTGSRGILITRGRKGIFVLQGTGEYDYIPVHGEDEVADATGAGDTVIGVFTLALAAGATLIEAARLANYAGGIVVMKSGTAPVYWAELQEAIQKESDARRE
ncbi:MAG: bifunctional heptose 7-phosphate kinase/heptose 1-phosphate adenyltransferase [bacterium]